MTGGTNLSNKGIAHGGTINIFLTDDNGNAILMECATANIPTGLAGYAVSCILRATDTAAVYLNTGSITSAAFTLLDTGEAFTLPDAITDSTTTTGTSFGLIFSTLTTGVGMKLTASATTTGIIDEVIAAAATLTGAGRYVAYNDGALNVFSIGPNGHIHTLQTTAPTIAVTTANGITAAAITAGSSDTAGNITTTGTNNNAGSTVLTVTFNKTYTTAPKVVMVTETNLSATITQAYVSSITATTFVLTIPASASSAATPSWAFLVIA